jgi:hypothetical protein
MKVNELRRGLEILADLLAAWGGKQSSRDLTEFAESLTPFDSETLSNLIFRLRDRQIIATARTRTVAALNTANIADYVSRLSSAGSAETALQVIDQMRRDKAIRIGEARKIAQELTGAPRSLSKKETLSLIEQFSLQNIRERGVFSSIDRMLGRNKKE